MKLYALRNDGVSEVLGIMLLLTITVIVACIVSTFAGGFSFNSKEDSISANIVASDFVDESPPYVMFDHLSGDPVDLNSIVITLGIRSSSKETAIIRNCDTPTGVDVPAYIVNYGEDSSAITVGDRFVLYADGKDKDGVFWKSESSSRKFLAPSNDCLTYQIIDTRSNKPISSGMIPVPK